MLGQKCCIVTTSHDRNVNVNIDFPKTLTNCNLGVYTREGIPGWWTGDRGVQSNIIIPPLFKSSNKKDDAMDWMCVYPLNSYAES